jgi:hypothetical protein
VSHDVLILEDMQQNNNSKHQHASARHKLVNLVEVSTTMNIEQFSYYALLVFEVGFLF